MDTTSLDPLRVPGLVRLLSRGGTDQIADPERFPECWNFEDPLPVVTAALLEGTDGTFYDVGANTGFYSILVGKLAPRCRIRSFEPVPSIAQMFRENLAANHVSADLHEVALSDRCGTAEIYFPPDDHGLIETSATLSASFNRGGIMTSTMVPTQTLDDMSESTGDTVDFIKIDVEGFEHAVLRGARQVVERDRPLVVIEVLPPSAVEELNDFVKEHDYGVLSLRPGMKVAQELSIRFIDDSWNQLLVPRERLDEVQDALDERGQRFYRLSPGSDPSSWADCESMQDFLMLQLRIEQAVGRSEAEEARSQAELAHREAQAAHQEADLARQDALAARHEAEALREEMGEQMARRARRLDVRVRTGLSRGVQRLTTGRR